MSKVSPKQRMEQLKAWMTFMKIKPKETGYSKYQKHNPKAGKKR